MTANTARKQRGNIEERGGAYRVRVYAGVDPVTKKPLYLRETIAAGPDAKRKAEKALTRLQNQVDERRAPRTSATLDQLLDRYLEVGLEVAPGTRRDYASKASKHIRPILGSTPIARIQADTLESLYADLRRSAITATVVTTSSTALSSRTPATSTVRPDRACRSTLSAADASECASHTSAGRIRRQGFARSTGF